MSASVLTVLSSLAVSWPDVAFLDAHDLFWEVPPTQWLEGIPLANGDMGALVWGDGAPLKVTLDKYDAWETREKATDVTYGALRKLVAEGKKKEAETAMQTQRIYGDAPYPTRLPMPRLEMDFGRPVTWDYGRLRLRSGRADIEYTMDGEPLQIGMFTHASENLLTISVAGRAAAQARFRVGLGHLDDGARATLKKWGYADPVVTETKNGGTLRLTAPSGFEYAAAWTRSEAQDGHTVVLRLALLSSHDAKDPLSAAQALADRNTPLKDERAAHEQWWADYWRRSYLTIPDARLEALYYAEMYKLGCVSRPGKMPITLQGLWTRDGGMPPWSGDYHLDMNVQQSYWPIYTANRLDLGEPLYRNFSECVPRWREQCKQFFGFDGIWAGCAIGPRGERVFGYSGVELWPGNVAWLAHHYWLHFVYSQDKAFLREQALPTMRLAFLTYANLLEPGDDGKLHVPLSYSPEWGEGDFVAYCKDPNCDLALIRFLAGALLKSNEELGTKDEVTDRAKDVLARLVDYVQKDERLMISAGVPFTHSHRHFSHLMAIHPLGLLTPEGSEKEKKLIDASLHDIVVRGTGEWTGWAFPWMSLIASRAGRGNMAWQMLDIYANSFIKPNTFHINGDPRRFGVSLFEYDPMTLEAGFGAAAAIMEILLQSNGGRIRLFPTMPDRWHDAYFDGLRAEGAFLITSKLTNGEVRFAMITSEAGRPCEIKNPFGTSPAEVVEFDKAKGDAVGKPEVLQGAVVQFPTKPGATYLLYPQNKKPNKEDLSPTRFTRTEQERNVYGVKRLARF